VATPSADSSPIVKLLQLAALGLLIAPLACAPADAFDGDAAVATRKRLFDRAAADRMLVTGYHFPFPACGHLIKTASGYEHVPVEWQPDL